MVGWLNALDAAARALANRDGSGTDIMMIT
jgi:hypothetical protein